MVTIRPMESGKGYSAKYLEHSDYYEQGNTTTGRWITKGASLLGLAGEVDPADFEAIHRGLHPETGESLASAPERDPQGQRRRRSKRRPGTL
jgi:hypothetical protein